MILEYVCINLALTSLIAGKTAYHNQDKDFNQNNEKLDNKKEKESKQVKIDVERLKKKELKHRICKGINIMELSITQFQNYVSKGKLTSEQLVNCYIHRIRAIDRDLKAVLQINKNAPAIARNLDRERRKGNSRGPLHGVPILIKDNIATGDGLYNTAGSIILKNSIPKVTASFIDRLRRKGAIILGKANLSLWSEVPSKLHNGWSPRGGQVRNPYVLSANPSGSSSGSAVAVATSMTLAAIGTDTHGSIGGPSGRNAVFGFKPTAGLVSRYAVIPFSLTHDTIGPITRNMMDAALIMETMAGADSKDLHNQYVNAKYKVPKYTKLINNNKLQGVKIGIYKGIYKGLNNEELAAVNKFVKYIKGTNAKVVEINETIEPETKTKKFDKNIHFLIDDLEYKEGMTEYLKSVKNPTIHTLTDINNINSKKVHEIHSKSLTDIDELKLTLNSKEYVNAVKINYNWYGKNGVDRILKKYNVDVLLTVYGHPCNQIGYPILTMPFPLDKSGLPIKKPAFCTTKLNESVLFKVGFALEGWTKRPTPRFKKCCSNEDFDKLT